MEFNLSSAEQSIREVIERIGRVCFPGKTTESIITLMDRNIGFSIAEEAELGTSCESIESLVMLTYLLEEEYHPESDDVEEEIDQKDDMRFWRTGLSVQPEWRSL